MPKGSGETDVRIGIAYDATVYDRIRGGDADPPTSVCLVVGGREVGRGRDHLRWHLGQLMSAASALLDGESAVVEFFEESEEFRFEPDGDAVETWFASDPGPEKPELTYPDGTVPDAVGDDAATEPDRSERVLADRRALVAEILSVVETFCDAVAETNPTLAESVADLRAETQSLHLAAAEFDAWGLPVRLLDTVAEPGSAARETRGGNVAATPDESRERRRTLVTSGGARVGVYDPDGRAEAAERGSRAVARIWLAEPTVGSAVGEADRRATLSDVSVGIDSGAEAFEWSGTRFRGEVVSVADGRAILDVGEGTVAFDPSDLPTVAVGDRLTVRAGRTDLRGLDVVTGPSAGDWSEDRLRGALSDRENRADAAAELARRGVRSAVPALVEALDDPLSASDRRAVVRALDVLSDPRAVDALVARLADDDEAVRRAAATALSTIGDPDALDALFDAASAETDGATRDAVVRAAREVDPTAAMDRFADVLRTSDDPRLRETVVRVLRVTDGDRAHELVVEALGDDDPSVVREAISVVRWDDDERAVPGLLRRLTDDDPDVRQEAAGAFAELGARAEHFQDGAELSEATRERVVEALIRRLDDPVSAVRSWAMEALGAQAHPNAVGPLCAAYGEESELRWNAVAALGRIGDPRAIPTVVAALDDDDPSVRRRACRASARLETTAATSPLCDRATTDPSADVRREAIDALGRLGEADARVVTAMESVLGDAPTPLRRAAVTALGRLGGPKARRLLREAAENDPSESVRERAKTGLE
ncbi:HEAT repeat [Halopelagius inordinatus]|uniref:HEAT repeat n=1 Tax=Halopelagius inordinatus TaxID=553467 RepID=A0A1I2WDY7_9EURY|nr:HEAT repeat domain-containing protein [Halopelagius inordinatus]SFG99543.1 HEAT repeat [Halopelagius inordinatus]